MKGFLLALWLVAAPCQAIRLPKIPPNDGCARALRETTIPYTVEAWDSIPAGMQEAFVDAARMALTTVANLAPATNHLFHWEGSRAILAGKTAVKFVLTTSAEAHTLPQLLPFAADADATSVALKKGNEHLLYVFLLVDRLFLAPDGTERLDAFTRLLAALAHAVHGNIQNFLEYDLSGRPPSDRDLARMQVRAFDASIDFLDRYAATVRSRAELCEGIAAARARAERARATWVYGL